MKKVNKKVVKKIWVIGLFSVSAVALFTGGIAATIAYNQTIDNIKAEGVAEYKLNKCDKYTDKEKKTSWLECDIQR